VVAMQNDLARYQAGELAAKAEEITLKPAETGAARHCRLVARAIDADANGLKSLASTIAGEPGFLVVLVSTSKPALVVIARSSDVDVSAQQVLKDLIAAFGGRGGGRSEMSQGGGLDTTSEAIFDVVRSVV
jgi:alanyl-tRNA synthetase